jgi:hypothetical protein
MINQLSYRQPSNPPTLQPSNLLSSSRGFLILEVMIASLILTASVAATMYLFRLGFQYLEQANDSNVISVKLPQAINLLKAVDLGVTKEGTEYMGDEVTMQWKAKLLEKTRPVFFTTEGEVQSAYELFLYRVNLSLGYKNISRGYEINVFRSVNRAKETFTVF